MNDLKKISPLVILATAICMGNATASGNASEEPSAEKETPKHAGKKLGAAGKLIEQAYKEGFVKPTREFREGIKEGKEEQKKQRKQEKMDNKSSE